MKNSCFSKWHVRVPFSSSRILNNRIYFLIFAGRNENSIINVIDVVYRYIDGGAIFVHKKFIVENLNDERGVRLFNNLHGLCGVKIVRHTLISGLMKNARVS